MKKINDPDYVKKVSFKILCDFDKFCRANNLRYTLAGGTLLGAIRHKGFIPWDDDIDVLMPRPDYEAFINLYPNNLYVVHNLKNMVNPFFAYTKLCDDTTLLVEDIHQKTELGIGLDIFPVDGLPSNMKEIKKHFKKINRIRNLILLKTLKIKKGKHFLNYLLKILLIPPSRVLLNLTDLIFKLDTLIKKYDFNTSEYVAAQAMNYGLKEVVKKEVFDNYVEVTFENRQFMAIKQYDMYLKQLFGDYMVLPPMKNRVSTHSDEIYEK